MSAKKTTRQFDDSDESTGRGRSRSTRPGPPRTQASPIRAGGVPPREASLNDTRPPRGKRTPAKTEVSARVVSPEELPRTAPGWMKRARRMSLALEAAIAAGELSGTTEACVERAWAAWELDGSSDRQIARVSHLIQRAHTAIRETTRGELTQAYSDCAEVLWNGLPAHIKRRLDFESIVELVRALRTEADSWTAMVTATAEILGWSQASRAHAAHALRVALDAHPPASENG